MNDEVIQFMQSIGFEYHDNQYYKHFTKNEGTCEMTMPGAIETMLFMKKIEADSRIEELKSVTWNNAYLHIADRIAELEKQRDLL